MERLRETMIEVVERWATALHRHGAFVRLLMALAVPVDEVVFGVSQTTCDRSGLGMNAGAGWLTDRIGLGVLARLVPPRTERRYARVTR